MSACHIAGKDNEADGYSRKINIHTEWMLNKDVFNDLCRKFGCPDIDLFASRNNHQLPLYMSWFLDCHAYAIAFSHV